MALIAVLFVAEWLFSGAAVDLHGKPPLQAVGYVTSSNWGMAAAASGVDLYRLEKRCIPGQPLPPGVVGDPPPCDSRWRAAPIPRAFDLVALVTLAALTTAGSLAALHAKDGHGRPPSGGFFRHRRR